MEIKELFNIMKNDYITEEILGEFYLEKNHILWSYDLNDELTDEFDEDGDYNEDYFNFDSKTKETLLEVFNSVFDSYELFLDSINEYDNWMVSEPLIHENTITAKIL